MNVHCETCCYWNPKEERGYTGQCRRNPPGLILTVNGLRAMYPITHVSDWCGEHAVEVKDVR